MFERTLHLEEPTFVAEGVEFGAIEKLPGLAVAHEGVIVPAIPETLDHFEIFIGNLVPQRVFRMIAAIILRRAFKRCRHRIPPGATAAQKVERSELTGNGEGIACRKSIPCPRDRSSM